MGKRWASQTPHGASRGCTPTASRGARIGELVGHADLVTTARTYTHVVADETALDYARLVASSGD